MVLRLRELTAEEQAALDKLAPARTAPARRVERARIIRYASRGQGAPAIAAQLRLNAATVRGWIRRFNAAGLAGRAGGPPARRPAADLYPPEQVATVIATALTDPGALDLPFASWTLDRPAAYLSEHKRIAIRRSRIDGVRRAEGLRWRRHESWFGVRVDPESAEKKGRIEALYAAPPQGGVVVCLDEMGPEGAKTFQGRAVVAGPCRAQRGIDYYGRRGRGYIFGAFRPATGEARSPGPTPDAAPPAGWTSWSRSSFGCRPRRSGSTRSWTT